MDIQSSASRFLVLLVVGALVFGCAPDRASPTPSSPAPAVSPAPTLTPTPAPSATPTATPSAVPGPTTGWRAVPDQPALRGVAFIALVRAQGRFVAVGTAADRVVVVDSEDGLAWHRGQDLGPGESVSVAALAAGPRGLVAVGTVSFRPAVWVSDDGLAWARRTGPFPMPALGGGTATVTGVVAGGDGWIAVGREDPACQTACRLDPVRVLVWTSPDGLKWTRVNDQPALEGGGADVIVRTDAGFVAAGVDARRAAAWTSPDGMAWARVADAPQFHPQPDTDPNAAVEMGLLAVGRGVVAGFGTALGVGDGGAPAAVAWWSADGRTWASAPVTDASPDYARSLAATTDGFLATGSTARGNTWFPITWWSVDGRSWATIPAGSVPDGFDPFAVAASPAVEVAVGSRGTTPASWWRPVR